MKLALQITIALCLLLILGIQIYHGFQLKQNGITQVCPVDAITMVNGKAVIDAKKCIGCRRCVDGIVISQYDIPPVITPENDSLQPDTTQVSIAITKIAPSSPAIPAPSKKSHYVEPSKCIGCGLCVPYCPSNAITMVEGKAVIDKDKCTNSDICVVGNQSDFAGCPVNAITAP